MSASTRPLSAEWRCGLLRRAASRYAVNEDRLTLLYGNNGTGKTSLLRLIFHGLSAAQRRGHRTALLQTRFQSFSVRLTNGAQVAYTRPEGRFDGPFRAQIRT